jgi:hypothetical protein
MKRSIIALSLFALAIVVATNAILFGSYSEQQKAANPFDGKYVNIYLKGSDVGHGFRLKKCKILDLEGAKLLSGTSLGSGDEDWTDGLEICVSIDNIGTMYVMTKEQMDEISAKFGSKH